jgi:hypothetical protein
MWVTGKIVGRLFHRNTRLFADAIGIADPFSTRSRLSHREQRAGAHGMCDRRSGLTRRALCVLG